MAKALIWATTEDLDRNKGRVLSLYRQILRTLNSPNLPLNLAARLSKKVEVLGHQTSEIIGFYMETENCNLKKTKYYVYDVYLIV